MTPHTFRLADLDLLRLLAALAVVFYHLTYTTALGFITRYGYLGVDLFFMISGFVILWSAQGATAREFCVSRFSRLYPAFWLCMAMTIGIVWLIKGEMPALNQVLANATMVAGYLGQEYVDGVYWTLQVELKFYLIILGLILIRQLQYIEYWLFIWLAFCAADTVIGVPAIVRMAIIAPYGPLFIAGCLCYLTKANGVKPHRLAGIAACMVLAAINALPNSEQYLFGERSYVAPLIVVGLFAVMMAVALGKIRVPGNSALLTLSALTYPLYLLHNEIGKAISVHSGPAVAVLLVIALAYLANRIDRPIAARVRALLSRPKQTLPANVASDS